MICHRATCIGKVQFTSAPSHWCRDSASSSVSACCLPGPKTLSIGCSYPFVFFPDEFMPLPNDVGFVARRLRASTTDAPTARNAITDCGTPLRILQLFYKRLGTRLVILQGGMCRYVHTPLNWRDRKPEQTHTVVLNVWNNHVFTYNRGSLTYLSWSKNQRIGINSC